MHRSRRSFLALPAALLFLAPAAHGQEKDLPTAEEVLDKYVEATGGKDAYQKLTNRVSKGRIAIPAQGIEGTIEVMQAEPGRHLVKLAFEDAGTASEGSDGEVAWVIDNSTGPRLIEDEERTIKLRENRFNIETHWLELYEKAETVGVEDVDGKPCYKVVLTPAVGEPLALYYDKETGLLARLDRVEKTPQGKFNTETYTSDYREVDGVKMPFASILRVPSVGFEMTTRVEEVKHNVELPAETFALPDDIKKLQESK